MPEDAPYDPTGMYDLVSCLAEAQSRFGSLPKDGHAVIASDKGRYEYDYITEGALMARTREILAPMGVLTATSVKGVEHKSGGSVWVTITVSFLKGSDRLDFDGAAEGVDPRDKAYNKAITTAVRLFLTKFFLQGGDVDPEQTVNERTTPLPGRANAKLSDARIKAITKAAIDAGVVDSKGAVDPVMLCRIASFTAGVKVTRIDEIPAESVENLVSKNLPGYAANQASALAAMTEMEVERGW